MFSFPAAPLILIVSEPLEKPLPADIFVKVAVVPDATLIIRLDVPEAVSVRESVSPVN